MKVIVVALEKGGVGKTTTSMHLGHGLAMLGYRVLMLDCDPQGSLSKRYDLSDVKHWLSDVLGVGGEGERLVSLEAATIPTQQENLRLGPSNKRLARTSAYLTQAHKLFRLDGVLHNEATEYDYIILDTPPGRSMMQTCSLVAGDLLIAPVELNAMGIEGWVQIDDTVTVAREHQSGEGRNPIRLSYGAVVPTKYRRGEQASDRFLHFLQSREHPDYEGMALPVSDPIPRTTHFEKASTPQKVQQNGHTAWRAQTIWDTPEEIAQRAGEAYMALAKMVANYG
jgi:cellulose biosynthesis protein BcsQ